MDVITRTYTTELGTATFNVRGKTVTAQSILVFEVLPDGTLLRAHADLHASSWNGGRWILTDGTSDHRISFDTADDARRCILRRVDDRQRNKEV